MNYQWSVCLLYSGELVREVIKVMFVQSSLTSCTSEALLELPSAGPSAGSAPGALPSAPAW